MFAKSIPDLIVNVEDSGKIAETIQKGVLDSGRMIADPNQMAMQQALAKGMPIESVQLLHVPFAASEARVSALEPQPIHEPSRLSKALAFVLGIDPAEVELKNTHGEQFHGDADQQVVDYLTTVEKLDLKNCPVHNPAVVVGPDAGWPRPLHRSMSGGDDLVKRAPKGVDAGKHERCVKDVKAQGHDVGSAHAICTASLKGTTRRKSMIEEALDLIEKSAYTTPLMKPGSPAAKTSTPKPIGVPKPHVVAKPPRTFKQNAAPKGLTAGAKPPRKPGRHSLDPQTGAMKSFDRDALMAKAFDWGVA